MINQIRWAGVAVWYRETLCRCATAAGLALILGLSLSSCRKETPQKGPVSATKAKLPKCDRKAAIQAGFDPYGRPPVSGITCDQPNGERGTGKLVVDGIDMTLGRALDATVADARKVRAKISRGTVTRIILETAIPSQYGDPFVEQRRYILASRAGHITGIRACETFQSGSNGKRVNLGFANAFGAPERIVGMGWSILVYWQSGAKLLVNGDPSIMRAEVGEEPEPILPRGPIAERALFDEVVAAEDRLRRDDGRAEVAYRHCMTSDELDNFMMQMHAAGMQPRD